MQNNKEIIDNIKSSTLETIDYAVFNWIDKKINASCNTNEGFKKVPIIWSSAERSFQIKNYKDLRDKDGSLITPFISIERLSINKNLTSNKGAFQANIVGSDTINYTSIINQEKTSKYANNSGYKRAKKINYGIIKTPKIVYQTKSIKIPIYFDISYSISIKTSFVQQINEILAPFITYNRSGKHFMIENDGFSYEAFLEETYDVEESSSSMDVEERKYITKLSLKVIGYLIDSDINNSNPRVIISENAVDIKFPKENIIFEETKISKRRQSQQPSQIGETITALKKIFLIGNGVDSIYTVDHGLETRDMYVAIRLTDSPYDKVEAGIEYTNSNSITIDTGNPISNNYLTVVIIG